MNKNLLLLAVGLLLTPLAFAAAAQETAAPPARGRGAGGLPLPMEQTLGTGPTCAFDGTVYELSLPAELIGRLDLAALDKPADVESFEKLLATWGTAKPLFRTRQSVRLQRDLWSIGTQTPYTTKMDKDDAARPINTVIYRSVGTILGLTGKEAANGQLEVDLQIQTSTPGEGGPLVAREVRAPVFRTVQISYKGLVTPGKPFVTVAIDASQKDAAGNAVATLARITIGAPQGATTLPARTE